MSSYDDRIREIEATLQRLPTNGDERISHQLRRAILQQLKLRYRQKPELRNRMAKFDIQLDRHEAKYLIPLSLVSKIREFIAPFCERDPHGAGELPRYVVTTLQLDSPTLALHRAKEDEALARFKLRVRTYGRPGDSAVYLEIKRKIRGTIVKSRASIPFHKWGEHVVRDVYTNLTFKSRAEETGFLDFVRLCREIDARPILLVRYLRESYFGRLDPYARITFDTRLEYQPTDSWTSWGEGGRWIPMDTSLAQDKLNPFSAVIMEVKTLSEAPMWMMDMIMQFNLERVGNCKYSSAVWLEAVYRGWCDAPRYAAELLAV